MKREEIEQCKAELEELRGMLNDLKKMSARYFDGIGVWRVHIFQAPWTFNKPEGGEGKEEK